MKRLCIFAAMLALLGASPAFANGRIFFDDEKPAAALNGAPFFGFVRDSGGRPVPEAQVTLESKEAKTRIVIQSDKVGHFYFGGFRKDFDPKQVEFSCRKDGYRALEQKVQPPRGKPTAKKPIELHCTLERLDAD